MAGHRVVRPIYSTPQQHTNLKMRIDVADDDMLAGVKLGTGIRCPDQNAVVLGLKHTNLNF